MPPTGIVEPVDVSEQGHFGLSPCALPVATDQFGLQRFEEALDHGVIKAITLAAHRDQEAMFLQACV